MQTQQNQVLGKKILRISNQQPYVAHLLNKQYLPDSRKNMWKTYKKMDDSQQNSVIQFEKDVSQYHFNIITKKQYNTHHISNSTQINHQNNLDSLVDQMLESNFIEGDDEPILKLVKKDKDIKFQLVDHPNQHLYTFNDLINTHPKQLCQVLIQNI